MMTLIQGVNDHHVGFYQYVCVAVKRRGLSHSWQYEIH